jgi:hypothetical protein
LERLSTDFCWLVDQGYANQTDHLFTEDVRYSAQGAISIGKTAVMKRMQARAANTGYTTRHLSLGHRFHVEGDGQVIGQSTLLVFRDTTMPAVVADVHDRYRRLPNNTWRIAERSIEAVMRATSE